MSFSYCHLRSLIRDLICNPCNMLHSRGGISGLSSKSRSSFSFFAAAIFCARFAGSSIIFRKSRISGAGPISSRTRLDVAGGLTVMTFFLRSLDSFFAKFFVINVDGIKRAILITRLPVVVFRWILLFSTHTSQGRVNCRIFSFMMTRT